MYKIFGDFFSFYFFFFRENGITGLIFADIK